MTHLVDSLFSPNAAIHANGDREHFKPSHVKWERGPTYIHNVAWFTDSSIPLLRHPHVHKQVGLLLEPPQLHPENYDQATDAFVRGNLDVLYTSHPNLFGLDDGGGFIRPYPHGGTRIHESDWRIWEKEYIVPSIIASPKRSLPGHKLRHDLIASMDVKDLHPFGPEYMPIKHKLGALAPYRFSVAIENVNTGLWFTEALLDCFLTGTVPIYWGSREAIEHWGFDPAGIIHCTIEWALPNVVKSVTASHYEDMLPAIERNFIKAHEYTCPEDWLWRHDRSLFDE